MYMVLEHLYFISDIHILLDIGVWVPLYHLKPYYCDYYYQTSGTRYIARGGNSGSSAICGTFCINATAAVSSNPNWTRGASLSFKSDRLNLFSYI